MKFILKIRSVPETRLHMLSYLMGNVSQLMCQRILPLGAAATISLYRVKSYMAGTLEGNQDKCFHHM
jgi:hypothetical protein